MEPFIQRCVICDGRSVGWADGDALCEEHWYERANAEAEAEERQRQDEARALESAEMDRHFREHPHG